MSHFPDAAFLTSANDARQFVADTGAEVAFAGRSNAGKSSAINTIVNRRQFARISKTPGRTQLVNFFALKPGQRLVDLPGYGFARVSDKMCQHWKHLMESYFDAQMLAYAEALQVPVQVLLTKADKLKRGQAARQFQVTRRELGERATVQLFSSLSRQGDTEARAQLERWLVGAA